MTKIDTWGPYTWFFLHIMAEKIKDEKYEECKGAIYSVLVGILSHLPCDYCAEHAIRILGKININTISTKEKLKTFIFEFHNSVNVRTKKGPRTMDELNRYKNGNLRIAAETLFKVFHTHDKEHMMNEFGRTQMLNGLKGPIQNIINCSN